MLKIEQENNKKSGRFMLYENEEFAGEMTYTWVNQTQLTIDHTSVEEKFGGKGLGKKLVMHAVEFARKNNVKISPHCSYAQKVFDRTEGIQDVRS